MKWMLLVQMTSANGFVWWYPEKQFKTKREGLKYKELHHRHSARRYEVVRVRDWKSNALVH